MAERIGGINEIIIVDKILVARVVGRVDVNHIDFALVCFLQKFQRCEIVALQQKV